MVLSKSDVTGEISYKRVVNTFIRQTQAIYKVTFEDGTILETTWNHPFRRLKTDGVPSLLLDRGQIESLDLSEWTEAKELKSGDLTFTADGKLLAISSIEVDGREDTVYNFEVEDFHTYFVGEVGVWVHNNDDSYNKGNGLLFTNTLQSNLKPDGAKKINEGIDDAVEGAKDLAIEEAKACVDGGVGSLVCGATLFGGAAIKYGGGLLARIPVVGSTIRAISTSRVGQGIRGIFGGAEATQGTKATTDVISNVTVKAHGKVVAKGDVYVKPTIDKIDQGVLKPREIFENREYLLPKKPTGYYNVYDMPTPGVKGKGPQRIISGQQGELYYTPDHYDTFIPLR
ncbi:MAG: hypothetical protein JJT78_16570 [Leptospira sp.]|nr:hypothetical protein [Leptospira sp.]